MNFESSWRIADQTREHRFFRGVHRYATMNIVAKTPIVGITEAESPGLRLDSC